MVAEQHVSLWMLCAVQTVYYLPIGSWESETDETIAMQNRCPSGQLG